MYSFFCLSLSLCIAFKQVPWLWFCDVSLWCFIDPVMKPWSTAAGVLFLQEGIWLSVLHLPRVKSGGKPWMVSPKVRLSDNLGENHRKLLNLMPDMMVNDQFPIEHDQVGHSSCQIQKISDTPKRCSMNPASRLETLKVQAKLHHSSWSVCASIIGFYYSFVVGHVLRQLEA